MIRFEFKLDLLPSSLLFDIWPTFDDSNDF